VSRGKWLVFFIVLAALVVRLIGIDQPFVDPWSWRQSDVAAIARNFLENGFYFARPQIDWAGNEPGYVGTEFPILSFVAALIYQGIGVHEWIGRIQGVFFFAAALPFFFLLLCRMFGEIAARWATFFYAFAPLSVVASRAFMPDVPSLSLAIVGIYFFLRWLEQDRFKWLLLSALLISLALLIKLPTALIGAPLLYLLMSGEKFSGQGGALSPAAAGPIKDGGLETAAPWTRMFARWEIWFFAVVALVPSTVWYWHAHRVAEAFYPYHFFGGGGFRIMNAAWSWKIVQQTVFSSLTPVLFGFALVGAFLVPKGRFTRLFHWWFAAMVLFVFFVGWGNRHQWYQLPLVPIAAAFAGCACQWAANFLRPSFFAPVPFVLMSGFFGLISYEYANPFYRPAAASLQKLGLELNEATAANALIIAATDGDPTIFYYAHRKGWHFLGDGVYDGNPLDSAQIIANLEKLRSRGATHLVFYAGTQWWLDYYSEFAAHLANTATLVEQTREFTIYKLDVSAP
jgi:hypothetical protein